MLTLLDQIVDFEAKSQNSPKSTSMGRSNGERILRDGTDAAGVWYRWLRKNGDGTKQKFRLGKDKKDRSSQ